MADEVLTSAGHLRVRVQSQQKTDVRGLLFLTSRRVHGLRGPLPARHQGSQLMAGHLPGKVFLGIFCRRTIKLSHLSHVDSCPLVLGSRAHRLQSLSTSSRSCLQRPYSLQGGQCSFHKGLLATGFEKYTGPAHWVCPANRFAQ